MDLGARECPNCNKLGVEQKYFFWKKSETTFRYCTECKYVFHYLPNNQMIMDHNIFVGIMKKFNSNEYHIPLVKLLEYEIALEYLPRYGISLLLSIWSIVLSLTSDILMLKIFVLISLLFSVFLVGKELFKILSFKLFYFNITKDMNKKYKKNVLKTLINNTFNGREINSDYYINMIMAYEYSKTRCIKEGISHIFN